jgi:hypothetical protein
MEQFPTDYKTEAPSRNHSSVFTENNGFSLGTCSLSEIRKLEPKNDGIETNSLDAINREFNNTSSTQTSWAYCTDAETGIRADISNSNDVTSVAFDHLSENGEKRVSRYPDGTISVELHNKNFVNDQFSLYNRSGMKTFQSYNTNDQTRVDEFFDGAGKLAQTTIFHVDSELKVTQEIIFKGTEKVLQSIEDRYWNGRTYVFKADKEGKLKLQKK